MAEHTRRVSFSGTKTDSKDFFASMDQGLKLSQEFQKIRILQQKSQQDFVSSLLKQNQDMQKFKLNALKAGVNPDRISQTQVRSFDPFNQQRVPGGVLVDPGGQGGTPTAIARSPAQVSKPAAIRPDQIVEIDPSTGAAKIRLDNGLIMPARLTIGPGGRITQATTMTSTGNAALAQILGQIFLSDFDASGKPSKKDTTGPGGAGGSGGGKPTFDPKLIQDWTDRIDNLPKGLTSQQTAPLIQALQADASIPLAVRRELVTKLREKGRRRV